MNLHPRHLAAALLCGLALTASAAPLEVRSLTMKLPADAGELGAVASRWPAGVIKMPFVGGGSPAVVARINQALFLEVLGMPAPLRPEESFTPLREQLPEGTAEQDFEVSYQDALVLGIRIDTEGCAAYCETYATRHNFDARTGRALALDDLFTPAAHAQLARRIDDNRRRLYREQIARMKKELAAAQRAKAPADALDDWRDRITLNQECLQGVATLPTRPTLAYVGWSLGAGQVNLHTGRCSNHAQRALDDVGDVVTTVPRADLPALLTPYGRALLLAQGEAVPPASLLGQVLRGKVGSAAVTLRLQRQDVPGASSGQYFYERQGRLITLRVERQGATWTLREGEGEQEAVFTLTQRGTGLTGTWEGKGKSLPVVLAW
jgi:hypothetical protein